MAQHYTYIVFAAEWPLWLFFLLSLVTLIVFFALRERKIRRASAKEITKHHALVNLELHAFQAQMDPHFIFNSLNAIHHYILTTSTDMASLYLTRFSRLMRLMIGNFNKEWISLQDELDALELYIQLEQLRFDEQFNYQINVLPDVNKQFTLIPPLIIQPYVQYAIWHRLLLRPQKSGGQLLITICKEKDRLFIQLEDNGVLITEILDSTGERQASGIDIASERLYMMSEKYHMQASIKALQIYDASLAPTANRLIISMQHVGACQSLAG
ncbi:histidine kinase [Chitinophaga polysaccharea]|uniref:Histidine kinase n=1 Tax=Chitinophaga polysaccharea TaxID=1293035 RepID=A0A561Q368_9BACT|nr:histidine kinase [Chitinophaga polysaccharea]TWF44780.1 histidine kinase [Chitinophaga polysaccharea]